MVRPFQELEILFSLFVVRKPQIFGFHNEPLPHWLLGCRKPESESIVHDLFECPARLAHFLLQQCGHILIESNRTSHIMMSTA